MLLHGSVVFITLYSYAYTLVFAIVTKVVRSSSFVTLPLKLFLYRSIVSIVYILHFVTMYCLLSDDSINCCIDSSTATSGIVFCNYGR